MQQPVCQPFTRLGVVLPSVNTVFEAWAHRALPEDVSLHVTRIEMPRQITPEALLQMDQAGGDTAMRQLASCRPAAIAYACFASSALNGVKHDADLSNTFSKKLGLPVFTAAGATLAACRAVGMSKVVLVPPYDQRTDEQERLFLASGGLEIVGHLGFGIRDTFALADLPASRILEAALAADEPSAQGFLLTCMNVNSHLAIEELERLTSKPVVTCTQAVLWQLLRAAGHHGGIPGGGMLTSSSSAEQRSISRL